MNTNPKIWEINTTNIQDKQIMEICEPERCPNLLSIYIEVLQIFLSNWPILLTSQSIDIREYTIKEVFNLLSVAIGDQDTSIIMTKKLTDSNILKEYTNEFALHTFSKNSVNWIPSILRFGSVSLPHIVYCYEEVDNQIDIISLCKMNLQFVNWFRSSIIDDKQIIELGERFPLIYWTCDFRMYFFSSHETIKNLRGIVTRIANQNNLKIVFQDKNRK